MTPALRVTGEVFALFPDAVLGVVAAHGLDNTGDGTLLAGPLRQEEERVRSSLAGATVAEHPHVLPWREAYRKFGAKPREHPPKPGEVIYKDDLGTLCRRWSWKEAERTKLTAETRHAVLVIEGLPPVGAASKGTSRC